MRLPRILGALLQPARVFRDVARDPRALTILAVCAAIELAITQGAALAALVLRQHHDFIGLLQGLFVMFIGPLRSATTWAALAALGVWAAQHRASGLRLDGWQSFCIAAHAYPAHTALVVVQACAQALGIVMPPRPLGPLLGFAVELGPSAALLVAGIWAANRSAVAAPIPAGRARVLASLCIASAVLALVGQALQVQRDWAVARPPTVGDLAPAFVAQGPDGAAWHSNNLARHVALIDFWATWCAPCVRSLPRLQALADKYGPRGLEVAALNVEPERRRDVQAFWHQHGLTLPLLQDAGSARARYAVQGLPTSFVVDAEGVVRHISQGPPDWDVLEQLIGRLLGAPPA